MNDSCRFMITVDNLSRNTVGYLAFDAASGEVPYITDNPFRSAMYSKEHGHKVYEDLVRLCSKTLYTVSEDGIPSDLWRIADLSNTNTHANLSVSLSKVALSGRNVSSIVLGNINFHLFNNYVAPDVYDKPLTGIDNISSTGIYSELFVIKEKMVLITIQQYSEFLVKLNTNNHQRIGQLFANTYSLPDNVKSDLFELDKEEAMTYITQHCVDWG